MRPFPEEVGGLALPVLEGGDGRQAFQELLRELAAVEAEVAQEGLFEVLAAAEVVALENVLDPAIEALGHTAEAGR